MASLGDLLVAAAQSVGRSFSESQCRSLLSASYPELRSISDSSSQEEKDSLLRQLVQRLKTQHLARLARSPETVETAL